MAKGRKSRAKEWLAPDKLLEIEGWIAGGMLEKDVAVKIGIARGTWFAWKDDFPDFQAAVKRGLEKRCKVAEKSLNKLIEGYDYEETRTELTMKGEEIVGSKQVTVTKHVPPSLGAIIFYLTNTHPERWQNTQQRAPDDMQSEQGGASGVAGWLKATRPTKKAVAELFNDEQGEAVANGAEPHGEQAESQE